MKRSEIDKKYKWDLTHIYKTENDFLKAIKKAESDLKTLTAFKGKLNNKKDILNYFKLSDNFDTAVEKIYYFAKLNCDLDTTNSKAQENLALAKNLAVKIGEATAFEEPELLKNSDEFLKQLMADVDFKDYDYSLKKFLEQKHHILNENEELILNQIDSFAGGFASVFEQATDADMSYGKITLENGEEKELTNALISEILSECQNREIRRTAFNMRLEAHKKINHTLAETYINNLKADVAISKIRKYKSCLSQALIGEDVPEVVYNNLLKQANLNNKSLQKWNNIKEKVLGFRPEPSDLYLPLAKGLKISFKNDGTSKSEKHREPFEDCYCLVKEALKPLGDDYQNLLNVAQNNNWIDVFETAGKRSGAYSWSSYLTHPLVLLNYSNDFGYASTVAHEMGHALHSYFSDKEQPNSKAGYKIFVAEVASTTNETLLNLFLLDAIDDLQKTGENKLAKFNIDLRKEQANEVKKYILSSIVDDFSSTFFRQTLFAEFEDVTHKMIESGEPLSADKLNETFFKLNKKQWGTSVETTDLLPYVWSYIPHFYYFYYVYKYATGIVSAITFAIEIYNEFKENEKLKKQSGDVDLNDKKESENKTDIKTPKLDNYINFLKSGGKMSPYEILKVAGVDLATDKPYKAAFSYINDKIDELGKLV